MLVTDSTVVALLFGLQTGPSHETCNAFFDTLPGQVREQDHLALLNVLDLDSS